MLNNRRIKINLIRDFGNVLIRREKYLYLFVIESIIDYVNLWNRILVEFGELVLKYELGDNLYKINIWKIVFFYCNMKVIKYVKFCSLIKVSFY